MDTNYIDNYILPVFVASCVTNSFCLLAEAV